MNKKGFVTSALLYGTLSLFLVLVVGTITIIAGRKAAIDKIKQSALDDVQELNTDESCFERTIINNNECEITKYKSSASCPNTVFIPERFDTDNCIVTSIGSKAFANGVVSNGTVVINQNIENIAEDAFDGNTNVAFINKGTKLIIEAANDKLWSATSSYYRQD